MRAPAAEGAANQALLQLLAGQLSLPRTAVVLERGATSRLKRLRLEGIGQAALLKRWPGLDLGEQR